MKKVRNFETLRKQTHYYVTGFACAQSMDGIANDIVYRYFNGIS